MSNIVIVGSGPAGVSAALYAVRAGVQTTVLTKGPGARGIQCRRDTCGAGTDDHNVRHGSFSLW